MKTTHILLAGIALIILSFSSSCKEETTTKPCDGLGNISFNNKTDSAVRIEIVEAHNTFPLNPNYIKGVQVEGDKSYKINIQGRGLYLDTSFHVSTCANIDFVILK